MYLRIGYFYIRTQYVYSAGGKISNRKNDRKYFRIPTKKNVLRKMLRKCSEKKRDICETSVRKINENKLSNERKKKSDGNKV